jgi:hypothetical protein
MKKIWYSALTAIVLLFVSCYEVNEEIVIDANGTGTYVTKMDMGAMLQMMQTMAGEEELTKNGLDKPIDTVISLKDVMDSVKDATPEQKRLFKDGVMKLQMNVKESILKADVKFPFNNYSDLQTLMAGAGSGGLGEAFKKIFSNPDSAQSSPAVQEQGLDQMNNVFDVVVTKKSITKKLNPAKYKALMDKPEMAQAKEMVGKGFEVLYTTTIKLPRPVKQSDNPMVKLSPDKKTITIKYDLMKIFETPDIFSYSIVY